MKQKLFYITFTILLGSMIQSCQPSSHSELAGYYMPDKAEQGGIVHQFESEGFQTGKEYWYYNLRETPDSTHLIITVYDEELNQQQLSAEKKVANGWIQQQLLLFFPDSNKTRTEMATVHSGNRFAFDLQDSLDLLHYSLEWEENLDGDLATKKLFRNSRFMGYDSILIMETAHKAAHFVSRDKVEDDREGTLTLDLKSDDYYVKGLGLVEKYQFYLKGDEKILVRHLKLTDTLRMTDLEKKLKDK